MTLWFYKLCSALGVSSCPQTLKPSSLWHCPHSAEGKNKALETRTLVKSSQCGESRTGMQTAFCFLTMVSCGDGGRIMCVIWVPLFPEASGLNQPIRDTDWRNKSQVLVGPGRLRGFSTSTTQAVVEAGARCPRTWGRRRVKGWQGGGKRGRGR